MKLKDILIEYKGEYENFEIGEFTSDSRAVKKGDVFVCISGPVNDGHNYAKDAVNKGAALVIAERSVGVNNEIIVKDSTEAFAKMCSLHFGEPQKRIKLLGVTGTNGKTSVTYMLKSILESVGKKVGIIGTIQNMIGDEVVETQNTTPGIYDMYRLLKLMADAGCEFCIAEVSSHALDQNRIAGLEFEVGMFTNLSQDHLDYHKTMENYLEAKKKLFKISKIAVLNFDDAAYGEIVKDIEIDYLSYSQLSDEASYSAKNTVFSANSTAFEFVGYETINRVKLNIGGGFTVYNAMCALIAAISVGVPIEKAVQGLNEIKTVKGRCETVETGLDYTIVIDYAHTPDGLENILKTFKNCDKNRLTVLFGCGGDRDKSKRAIMGEIAGLYADNVIVTSDNPRSENPMSIIEDIVVGVQKTKTPYSVIEDRVEAIKFAMKNAQKDDIIVLAGKGHETYQILADKKIDLDEREVIKEILSKKD